MIAKSRQSIYGTSIPNGPVSGGAEIPSKRGKKPFWLGLVSNRTMGNGPDVQKLRTPFLRLNSGRRSRPIPWLALVVFVLVAPCPAAAEAQSAMPDRVLIVGTKEAPPFSMRERDGSWAGISIDLWRRIANNLHLRYRFQEVPLQELIDGTAAGRLDASISAITVTPDRERVVDFSEPYFTTSLGIAVPRGPVFNWLRLFGSLISFRFVQALVGLVGVTLLIGIFVWILERRHTEHFGGDAKAGLATGVWWSALTLTQSVPERGPETLPGRLIALSWMAASVVSIAVMTAGVTSHLTAEQLEGDVHDAADLSSVHAGAALGSSSMNYLSSQHIDFEIFPDFGSGLDAIKAGKLDAFVHDKPILYWLAKNQYQDAVKVLDVTFNTQDYAIALPDNSPLRMPINRALMAIINSQEWQDSIKQYLGTD